MWEELTWTKVLAKHYLFVYVLKLSCWIYGARWKCFEDRAVLIWICLAPGLLENALLMRSTLVDLFERQP
jgi:hypothetical protein